MCLQISWRLIISRLIKMPYIFLLKLKKLTFIRYSSKILKFRFSLKRFEENNMTWVAWMRLFLTTVVKTGMPNLIKYTCLAYICSTCACTKWNAVIAGGDELCKNAISIVKLNIWCGLLLLNLFPRAWGERLRSLFHTWSNSHMYIALPTWWLGQLLLSSHPRDGVEQS